MGMEVIPFSMMVCSLKQFSMGYIACHNSCVTSLMSVNVSMVILDVSVLQVHHVCTFPLVLMVVVPLLPMSVVSHHQVVVQQEQVPRHEGHPHEQRRHRRLTPRVLDGQGEQLVEGEEGHDAADW